MKPTSSRFVFEGAFSMGKGQRSQLGKVSRTGPGNDAKSI
jgi:hypothetical protein